MRSALNRAPLLEDWIRHDERWRRDGCKRANVGLSGHRGSPVAVEFDEAELCEVSKCL